MTIEPITLKHGISGKFHRAGFDAAPTYRFWLGVLASFACGLLFALSVPPWGFWPLAFLGVTALDFLLDQQRARIRFLRATCVGLGWLFPSMFWMWDFSPMGYITAGVGFSLFYGLGGLLCPPDSRLRWFALPALLVFVGFWRWNWPFGGVPLSTLAMSQASSPLLETNKIFGPLLLVWLVGVGGVSLAALLRRDWIMGAVGPALLALTAGLAPLAPTAKSTGETIQVALVQGGGEQRTRAEDTNFSEVLARHEDATKELISEPVDLIVWPENVVDVDGKLIPEAEGQEFSAEAIKIADVAEELDAPIIAGVIEDEGDDAFNNFSIVITPERTFGSRYDKVQRVPFGEYVPLRWLVEPFAPDYLPSREATVGKDPAVLQIDNVLDDSAAPNSSLTAGIVISWEIFFEHRVRDAINNGGTVLLNPTNGSSYWLTIVQSQQIAASKLRAVESDRFVLQVAPTGFSAIVSPKGEVLQRTGTEEQRVILAEIELREGKTLAIQLGPWPMLGLALITFAYGGIRYLRGHNLRLTFSDLSRRDGSESKVGWRKARI